MCLLIAATCTSLNSLNFIFDKVSGSAEIVPKTPPGGAECPNKGDNCKMINMTPMPDIKPEITLYGINVTYFPSFSVPISI